MAMNSESQNEMKDTNGFRNKTDFKQGIKMPPSKCKGILGLLECYTCLINALFKDACAGKAFIVVYRKKV